MRPAIVIRPQPGCDASVAALCAQGIAAHGFPLFEIRAMAWDAPDPAGFDALLAGSGNVFRHGGASLAAYRALPVHAVGEATAAAARAAGFGVAGTGSSGGLQAVIDAMPEGRHRLLRLAARARVELSAPAGITIVEREVYESVPFEMPGALAALLREPAVIALHSAEAARHFASECERLGLSRAPLALAAIGPRVSAAAGHGWACVEVAGSPHEAALLALVAEMCQGHDRT